MSCYVLSLNDYEDYQPHWFECDCTKEIFEASVRYAFERAVHYLLDICDFEEDLLGGYDLMKDTIRFLEEDGYKLIKPDHEVSIHGMCYYYDREDRPDLIPEKSWKKIIDHNEQVQKEIDAKYFLEEQEAGNKGEKQ